MPTIKEYSRGAVIYFEGDKSDKIYLLQSGQVILIYNSLDGSKEEKYIVKVGEFFGVKSALGKYPREETAQVVGSARVVILSLEEFQKLALSNTRLVLQMSKVFSRELRQIHAKIREILKADSVKNPEYELMNVGESFHRAGNIDRAEYVYEKYLYYNPKGKFRERAEFLLTKARKGESYPSNIPSLEDYLINKEYEQAESTNEDNLRTIEDDLFQIPDIDTTPKKEETKVSLEDIINKIEHFISNNQIKEAYDFLLENEDLPSIKAQENANEELLYQKGRLLTLMKNYKSGLEFLLQYIKDYPDGKHVKNVLFQIGIIFEILKDLQKAKMFYKKVLMFKPLDDITKQAKRRLEYLESQ
ncbi:MAG: cyclic nucleotide-binding domain-containing protein [Leptospiraceae bacterium]|nr:cyclic nucleotide-binding domain-containing protein [Leptospiraceae bacterium]MDW7976094.1 cyclic nucleotide-binding domain-containing protein [Leptospiraceae bacterium]